MKYWRGEYKGAINKSIIETTYDASIRLKNAGKFAHYKDERIELTRCAQPPVEPRDVWPIGWEYIGQHPVTGWEGHRFVPKNYDGAKTPVGFILDVKWDYDESAKSGDEFLRFKEEVMLHPEFILWYFGGYRNGFSVGKLWDKCYKFFGWWFKGEHPYSVRYLTTPDFDKIKQVLGFEPKTWDSNVSEGDNDCDYLFHP